MLWQECFLFINIVFIPIGTLLLLYLYYLYYYNYWNKLGIKGPLPFPFIGNVLHPFRPIALMHQEYLKKYGTFFGMYQGKRPLLVIADPIILKRILVQDFHLFRNRISSAPRDSVTSQNLLSARDENWKRMRSILTPMFTTSKLKKIEPLIGQCVNSVVNAIENFAENNLSFLAQNVMGNFTMDVIAKCAFATDTNAHCDVENQFVKHARQLLKFKFGRIICQLLTPSFLQKHFYRWKVSFIFSEHNEFFKNTSFHLIHKRKFDKQSENVQDMLQLMIKAEHGKDKSFEKEDLVDSHHVNVGEKEQEQEEKLFREIIGSKYLSEEEIVANSVLFFLAGYETTGSTLSFCLYELATNPDIQEKLYQEIKSVVNSGQKLDYNNVMKLEYLDAVISETLRLHSPALILSREASEDYYIPEYDFTVKKGLAIMIPVYAIHHYPQYYKNPEIFDPERFMPENRQSIVPYTYLPFGGGPRNCIGMRFAMSESKLSLAQIINQFQICRTKETVDELKMEMSLFLLKKSPIYIGVKRRNKNH